MNNPSHRLVLSGPGSGVVSVEGAVRQFAETGSRVVSVEVAARLRSGECGSGGQAPEW